jgi:hypothetical protein
VALVRFVAKEELLDRTISTVLADSRLLRDSAIETVCCSCVPSTMSVSSESAEDSVNQLMAE